MAAKPIDPMLLIRDAVTEHIRDVAEELRFWLEQMNELGAESPVKVQKNERPKRDNVTPLRRR